MSSVVWVVSKRWIKANNEVDAEYWVWHLKEPRHDQGMLMYEGKKWRWKICLFPLSRELPTSSWIAYLRDLSPFTPLRRQSCSGLPASTREWYKLSYSNELPQSLLSLGWSTVKCNHWLFSFAAQAMVVHSAQLSPKVLDQLPQLPWKSTESPGAGFTFKHLHVLAKKSSWGRKGALRKRGMRRRGNGRWGRERELKRGSYEGVK